MILQFSFLFYYACAKHSIFSIQLYRWRLHHVIFMPSGNQTKLWPFEKYWLESFIMSVPSPFLINSFCSFCLLLIKSSGTDLKCFGRLAARNCPQGSQNWSQPLVWTELQFAKFQNILASASWFHAWTPASELQTKNVMEIMCWFQNSNIGDLQLEEQSTAKLQGCQEEPEVKKSENLFE